MATNGTKSYPLFRDLCELALTSASEPQINLHFPMFRHAGSRVSTRKHKTRAEVAVVVKTYDMRGRLGLMEDELHEATRAYQVGEQDLLIAKLSVLRIMISAAIEVVGTEAPTPPEKPDSGRL